MPLSSEDVLRLNVLLAGQVDAIRIDESRMTVYGLNDEQEARIQLNPNCRDEQYLKQVREMLSGHVLGSPGGYPVYLKRWTRMGQARDESLSDLLKLGEPEAVMAVVCAPGLTNELARLAWWVAPEAEHARRMLERDNIVQGSMGPELANFLVEYLPFEEDPLAIIRSVSLLLQPGLIDDEVRMRLWEKGRVKNVYRIGFLQATPHDLPEQIDSHPSQDAWTAKLNSLADDNYYAQLLTQVISEKGQSFLEGCEKILRKPANQEVVSAILDTIGSYFRPAWREPEYIQDINVLLERAENACKSNEGKVNELLSAMPELEAEIRAMLTLSQVTEAVAIPVFSKSDAIGTVMRRQLEPITSVLFQQLSVLKGRQGA